MHNIDEHLEELVTANRILAREGVVDVMHPCRSIQESPLAAAHPGVAGEPREQDPGPRILLTHALGGAAARRVSFGRAV